MHTNTDFKGIPETFQILVYATSPAIPTGACIPTALKKVAHRFVQHEHTLHFIRIVCTHSAPISLLTYAYTEICVVCCLFQKFILNTCACRIDPMHAGMCSTCAIHMPVHVLPDCGTLCWLRSSTIPLITIEKSCKSTLKMNLLPAQRSPHCCGPS